MATTRPNPRPKTQAEILSGKDDVVNRAEQVRRDDTITTFSTKLIDLDYAIKYFMENIIQPTVEDNGEVKQVPIVYGSPERWMSVQKDGFLRDQKGRLIIPLIMFKRNKVTKDRTLSRNMDANNPRVTYSFERQYTPRNNYDQFSILTNATPQKEFHNVVIPDYLKLTYEVIIWTNQMDQMNKIQEAIIYAESSYWGDPEKFKFYVHAEDFDVDIINAEGEDRTVKSTFTLNLNGYIVADALQKEINQKSQKSFSLSKIDFEEETVTDGFQPADGSKTIIGSLKSGNILTSTVSQQAVAYLLANLTRVADIVTTNTATFLNNSMLTAPTGLPTTSVDNFTFFANGQYIVSTAIISFSQSGVDLVLTINPTKLGFSLDPSDEIVGIGKFST